MITAVDTNIVLDILMLGAPHGDSSEKLLEEAVSAGATIISEPVYSELSARFALAIDLDEFLMDAGIRIQPSSQEALFLAGKAWQTYNQRRPAGLRCPSCGASCVVKCIACDTPLSPRQHVLADFQIGSHALVHAERLLTRDRGYYRAYFPNLVLG